MPSYCRIITLPRPRSISALNNFYSFIQIQFNNNEVVLRPTRIFCPCRFASTSSQSTSTNHIHPVGGKNGQILSPSLSPKDSLASLATTPAPSQSKNDRKQHTQIEGKSNTNNVTVVDDADANTINSKIFHRLLDISKPEQTLILASAGTLLVTSSITLLLPYACGHVLDMAILEATTTTTSDGGGNSQFSPFTIALGLFSLTGMAGLGVFARSYMLNIAGNRIISRIRRRLFASIVAQDSAFFDKTKSGDLISRLTNDAWYIKAAMTTEAVAGLRGTVMSVGSTSLLFYTSPTLAMVSLLSIPPVFLMARIVGRTLKEKQKSVQALHASATDVGEEVFGGIKTVKLFNAEGLEYDRYATAITSAHDKEIEVGKAQAAFDGVVHVAANGAVLLVMGYGGTLVLAGELSAGELTGFLMYSLLMAGNVSSLSGTYAEVMKSIAAAGRVFDIIDRVPEIPSSVHGSTGTILSHGETIVNSVNPLPRERKHKESISITFDGVGFAYPARPDAPVLGPDFTLDIIPGENIALVGGSGSGKSTVAVLLARLYNLDCGRILLNGQNIDEIDPAIVREQIGVVAQEPLLFFGSIADNIRYGRPGASDEEVKHNTHITCIVS